MALVLDPERYETHAFGWCCEPQRTTKRVMEEAVRLWAESHGWASIAHCIRAGRFKATGNGAGDVQGYEYHQFDRALRQMLSQQWVDSGNRYRMALVVWGGTVDSLNRFAEFCGRIGYRVEPDHIVDTMKGGGSEDGG